MTKVQATKKELTITSPNYKLLRASGDGNCMFRCIAYAIGTTHSRVRDDICNYLSENCDKKAGSGELTYKDIIEADDTRTLEEYVEVMRNSKVWGGAVELQCAATLYAAEIRVYRFKAHRNLTFLDMYTTGARVKSHTIRLAYHMSGHYDLIMSEADYICLLYTSPSPRDATLSRMPSSA